MIAYLVWIMYSFLEGVREAFSLNINTFRKIKCPHWSKITIFQRIIFFLLIGYFIFTSTSVAYALIFLTGMLPIFYYIQNGTYFLIRNKMNSDTFIDGYSSDAVISDRPIMYWTWKVRSLATLFGILSQSLIWFI